MKIIAELCQNHNGDINLVKDMVAQAKYNGADIVKIQSIKANSLIKIYTLRQTTQHHTNDDNI